MPWVGGDEPEVEAEVEPGGAKLRAGTVALVACPGQGISRTEVEAAEDRQQAQPLQGRNAIGKTAQPRKEGSVPQETWRQHSAGRRAEACPAACV